jgi:hypothetical protein
MLLVSARFPEHAHRHPARRAFCNRIRANHELLYSGAHRFRSGVIHQAMLPSLPCAMRATVELLANSLHAVPNDSAATFAANRRKTVDGALERIERKRFPVDHEVETLIVCISAMMTCFHDSNFLARNMPRPRPLHTNHVRQRPFPSPAAICIRMPRKPCRLPSMVISHTRCGMNQNFPNELLYSFDALVRDVPATNRFKRGIRSNAWHTTCKGTRPPHDKSHDQQP